MPPLRASEIGEYVFCHRAWWLHHVQGYESGNARAMQAGTELHARHGGLTALVPLLRWLAIALFVIALLLGLFSFLPSLF